MARLPAMLVRARLPHGGILSGVPVSRSARVRIGTVTERSAVLREGGRKLVPTVKTGVPSAFGPTPCVQHLQQIGASSPRTNRMRLQYSAWAQLPPVTVFACILLAIRSGAAEPTSRRIGRPTWDWSERSTSCSSLGSLERHPAALGMPGRPLWLPRPSVRATLWPGPGREIRGSGPRVPGRRSCAPTRCQCVTLK